MNCCFNSIQCLFIPLGDASSWCHFHFPFPSVTHTTILLPLAVMSHVILLMNMTPSHVLLHSDLRVKINWVATANMIKQQCRQMRPRAVRAKEKRNSSPKTKIKNIKTNRHISQLSAEDVHKMRATFPVKKMSVKFGMWFQLTPTRNVQSFPSISFTNLCRHYAGQQMTCSLCPFIFHSLPNTYGWGRKTK